MSADVARREAHRREEFASAQARGFGGRSLLAPFCLVSALAMLGGLSGCGESLDPNDCDRVGAHLRTIWDREAELVPGDKKSERGRNAVKREGEAMQAEWQAACRVELQGRRVDSKEIECILKAESIAEVELCAAPAP